MSAPARIQMSVEFETLAYSETLDLVDVDIDADVRLPAGGDSGR